MAEGIPKTHLYTGCSPRVFFVAAVVYETNHNLIMHLHSMHLATMTIVSRWQEARSDQFGPLSKEVPKLYNFKNIRMIAYFWHWYNPTLLNSLKIRRFSTPKLSKIGVYFKDKKSLQEVLICILTELFPRLKYFFHNKFTLHVDWSFPNHFVELLLWCIDVTELSF